VLPEREELLQALLAKQVRLVSLVLRQQQQAA
jgi:hypothetical protein